MKFRQANIDDVTAMSEIRLAVIENVLSDPGRITRQMYEDYLSRLGCSWVCEVNRKIVGFSSAAKADYSIWALFVSPQFEGRGIGKRLLQMATGWLFELGAEKIILGTAANTRADRFYLAQGWQRGDMKDNIEVSFTLWRSGKVPNIK